MIRFVVGTFRVEFSCFYNETFWIKVKSFVTIWVWSKFMFMLFGFGVTWWVMMIVTVFGSLIVLVSGWFWFFVIIPFPKIIFPFIKRIFCALPIVCTLLFSFPLIIYWASSWVAIAPQSMTLWVPWVSFPIEWRCSCKLQVSAHSLSGSVGAVTVLSLIMTANTKYQNSLCRFVFSIIHTTFWLNPVSCCFMLIFHSIVIRTMFLGS